jgi:RNA polymerase sigma factor (sigma-70 family)
MRAADRRLTDGQRELVESYLRTFPSPMAVLWAVWPAVAGAAVRCNLTDDEVRSAAHAGACRAAQTWSPDLGASFATYANRAVMFAVVIEVRASDRRGRRDGKRVGRLPTGRALGNLGPGYRERGYTDLPETVAGVLRQLPERDRSVLEMLYGLNGRREMGPTEVAAALGVTRERVRQLRARAEERVRVPLVLGLG